MGRGVTLTEKWSDGASTLFGLMSRGFPNMFMMPAPTQQSVVTTNYTQLAVLGAEFIGSVVAQLKENGVEVFDVSAEAEDAWVRSIVDTYADISAFMSACTPSRINNEGHPESDQTPRRELRWRHGRLVPLPRAAGTMARRGEPRRPGARAPLHGAVTTPRQRVAVVTGGGGGIGGAIAEELGRGGWFVVTVDPLVTLDGSEQLSDAGDTTAGRIVAAGGAAQASAASVTDGDAIHALFRELADQHGGVDAVVNVAGITRQSYFAQGSEEDWQALLSVHLGGYLNVLDAALPLMACGGTRPHSRRHLRIRVAGGGRRRIQRCQAGRGRTDLAVGGDSPAGCHRQRDIAHREHPHGRCRTRARPSGGQGRWGWGALAQLHARARRTWGRSGPISSATSSAGAPARSSSQPARRWRWSTSPDCSRWFAPTG